MYCAVARSLPLCHPWLGDQPIGRILVLRLHACPCGPLAHGPTGGSLWSASHTIHPIDVIPASTLSLATWHRALLPAHFIHPRVCWQKIKTQRDRLRKHSIKIEALMNKEKEAAKTLAKAGQRECVASAHRACNHPFTHHHGLATPANPDFAMQQQL